MDNKTIKHLKELEAESIYVLREVAAQFERPVILFSGSISSWRTSRCHRSTSLPKERYSTATDIGSLPHHR